MIIPGRQDFVRTAGQLTTFRRPLLMSHAKPDGDAIGSLLAMRSLLAAHGARPTAFLFDKLPTRYAFLNDGGDFSVGGAEQASSPIGDADSVVIVDTCSYGQLEPVAAWLRQSTLPKLVIDHHGTRDPITESMLIDVSASATCSIIYELARTAAWAIDPPTATSLFVGIATDTGWFRHSNTDSRALQAASELTALGVKPHELYEVLYNQDSVGRVRLLGESLSTLELHANGQIAMMSLSRDAFRRAEATPADTEDIVNEPLRITSVVVSVLLVEQDDGVIRINFRSKAPAQNSTRPNVNVAAIAKEFGGGGHHHAAGARSTTTLAEVRVQILTRLKEVQ